MITTILRKQHNLSIKAKFLCPKCGLCIEAVPLFLEWSVLMSESILFLHLFLPNSKFSPSDAKFEPALTFFPTN